MFCEFPIIFISNYYIFTRISRAKILFLTFDRLISDYIQICSLVILYIHNLLQNIFVSSPTPGFWLNWFRNFIKISVTTPKPQNLKMHASPISKFLSMIQYSYSFKFVFIFFVPHKIGLKVLSGTFFRIGLSLLEAEI